MFWTEEKLQQRISALEPFRYRDIRSISQFRLQDDPDGAIGTRPPQWGTDGGDTDGRWGPDSEGTGIQWVGPGARWSGRDRYVWLSAEVEVPAQWQDRRVLGRFHFGQGGGGNNSGFESLLYVNGCPYQGVDTNHQEVFLDGKLCGQTVRLEFRLWSGLGGYDQHANPEHRINRAELCWLDEAADDLYFTAWSVLETVKILAEDHPDRAALLALLDSAFMRLDWSKPGSDRFYETVAEAAQLLQPELARMQRDHPVEVQCIGHTHIDVAWLWRLQHTREKAARSFSTVLRLMEMYPDYVFLQTQPQLYEYIKQDYPDIYENIRSKVKQGTWEAGGAMWLEADCNLTSGESLVRQILYGTAFFRREFGTECKYLWLPDVFGYSWALPQILRKSGIEMFMTTKISWNQYNRMPHDTFMWRGIDGTEIPTHFITTPEEGQQEGSFFYTYNGLVNPFTIQGIWKAYRNKELNRKLLLSYGYGDGGGGVNREMLEVRRRLAHMPGLPRATTGRADDYFAELKQTVEKAEGYVHTWDGELYLELHRGTYTSQAYNKRMNRKLELMYRDAEWLASAAALAAGSWDAYPGAALHEGWKIILRNQFHDIIPGSSIREVYEDSRQEYEQAVQLGEKVYRDALGTLALPDAGDNPAVQEEEGSARLEGDDRGTGRGGPSGEEKASSLLFTVYNSASFRRSELVELCAEPGITEQGSWSDEAGHPLEAQYAEGKWHVHVPSQSGMSFRSIYYAAEESGADYERAAAAEARFRYGPGMLETPHYRLEWNNSGHLTRIYDRDAGREVIAEGSCGNLLQVFEDRPKGRHEAWDIDIFYTEKTTVVSELESVRLAASGPLYASVEFVWRYMDSRIVQTMIAYSHSRRIDFRTEVDWHEQRQLLKAAFPVDIRATEATYDIQFGNVKRPTHWNTSWDWARFETVGHQWADLSEGDYGVSLLNDCKYGYDIRDNVMRLTLIKSAMVPDDTADQGGHVFTYALLPHEGDWFNGGTAEEAWALNAPLAAVSGQVACQSGPLLWTDCRSVFIDAVKKAEESDALVVRLHEFAGRRGEVRLGSGWGAVSWQECDLLERPVSEAVEGAETVLRIKPYEIKTFLVRFK
ncbi:MAG: alpha-mannosidase [Paenibacillaceae bacterium]|jgi:alpha-mannosidase|nr:alpha-mannosidase [Paenibacillaceae bacterium]